MKIFLNIKSLRMLLFGFSSGLPILLVFSTLSVWLVKAGVSRSTITMFSWAALAYSFKFIWSPIIDNLRIPIKNLGHRKSWLLISQLMIILSLIFISLTDPSKTLVFTAIGSVLIAFSSASQDIIIDAYRIESAPQKMQGALSSMYIAGYRIAMLIAGAGSLYLASFFGVEVYDVNVWKKVYLIMALLMFIGVFTTLYSPEPNVNRKISILSLNDQLRFLISFILAISMFIFIYSLLENPFNNKDPLIKFFYAVIRISLCFLSAGFLVYFLSKINFVKKNAASVAYISPVTNFIERYGRTAVLILLLIGLYRIADIVMGVVANVFYLDKGYNIKEIATYSKFFGVFATIIGGIIGGYSAVKIGTLKALFFGALIAAASNLLFAWLAISDPNIKNLNNCNYSRQYFKWICWSCVCGISISININQIYSNPVRTF